MSSNQNQPGQAGGTTADEGAAPDLTAAVRAAVREFCALSGKEPDSVTGARRAEGGGWSVLVDVVELERIPSSTSVLATYRVDIDRDGGLGSYERLRRYSRGATDPT